MKWTTTLCVDAHDTDMNHTVRPAAMLRYMQSAANLQLHHLGPSNEELLEKGQAFILSRIAMRFYQPLAAYDEIAASTWSCPSRGFSFQRCYDIRKGDTPVAEAVSLWALVDIASHRLLRTDAWDRRFTDDPPITPDVPLRFTLPEDMAECGVHTVGYSEIDQNHHMNNVRYLDMLCDFLDMRQYTVKAATIAFLNEAPAYSRIRLFRKLEDNVAYFSSFREDGKVNIEARLELASR